MFVTDIRDIRTHTSRAFLESELQPSLGPNPGGTGAAPAVGQPQPPRPQLHLRRLARRHRATQGSPSS